VNNNSFVNLNCYGITIGPQCNDNAIHHCTSGNGVSLYYSNPYFLRNSIYDNDDYGVYCNGSSPQFDGDQSGPGNNVVAYNGSYGIYINASSLPVLGRTTFETSQNSYYSNNTYEAYSLNPSLIGANYCYWGGGSPQVYGNIWTLNYLTSDPNPDPHGLQKAITSTSERNSSEPTAEQEINDEARHHFELGWELEQKGNYDAALEQYKSVISSYPQTLEA